MASVEGMRPHSMGMQGWDVQQVPPALHSQGRDLIHTSTAVMDSPTKFRLNKDDQ